MYKKSWMRVISGVSIQERHRQPLSEDLKGYFRDPGFDPKYIEHDSRKRKFVDGIRDSTASRQVGFTKEENLSTGCDIGKENGIRETPGWQKFGMRDCREEKARDCGIQTPAPSPPSLPDPVIHELTRSHPARDINNVHSDW